MMLKHSRTYLFVPGHKGRLIQSALNSQADSLIIDLEDSVQLPESKEAARSNIRKVFKGKDRGKKNIYVRVNDRDSGCLLADILATADCNIDGYVYPKSNCAEDVYFIDKLLETVEYHLQLPIGMLKLIPLIETASAVLKCDEIACGSSRNVGLAFGSEDYLADTGGRHTPDERALEFARNMVVLACKARDLIPVDTVHVKVHDLVDFEKNLKIGKALGFEAVLCLHPKEIELAHQYFSPTSEEISEARAVLSAASTADCVYDSVFMVGEKFIGPPLIKAAQKVIDKAGAFGLI